MTLNTHTRSRALRGKTVFMLLLAALLLLSGCSELYNMEEQPSLDRPYAESPNFGVAARDLDPNAVPVGFLRDDTHMYQGRVDGSLATTFPMEITESLLLEGQRQYQAFCAPCHGYSGYADGVIAQEGFANVQSFHTDELRARQVGYIYDVITNGVGQMYSYDSRIQPEDRWAIVAYIRAMQLSQYAETNEMSEEVLADFQAGVGGDVDPNSPEAMTLDDAMADEAEPDPAATEAMDE